MSLAGGAQGGGRSGTGGEPSGPFSSHYSEIGPGLVRGLRNTGVSVFCQDDNLRILWAQNVPQGWAEAAVAGATDADYLPSAVAERLGAVKRAVLESAGHDRLQVSVPTSDGMRWFDIWVEAERAADGAFQGIITTAVEITEQRQREQTLRTLLREVSHRSKNLLAIIQSIATQTGRYSTTIDGFLARFRGRLQSLAASQDLVTSSNWRGADLRDLVLGQVSRYTAVPGNAIRLEGEHPWLSPNGALHVGLALHELAVNSVSYGALSRPDGYVTVSARRQPVADDASLALTWRETIGAPSDEAPDPATRARRFGSVALERVVPAALNGSANLDISEGQLVYSLVIPPGSFELD